MQILIFDSGVGGLSVYKEIKKCLPLASYVYAFDNAAFPYGELDKSVLIDRATLIIESLVKRHGIDLVVVACNTASTIVLPILREKLAIPVVGVVPAIKPAASKSASRRIGLLATPATIERPYTDQLIQDFANDCDVLKLGSTDLVRMAEDKLRGIPVDERMLSSILAPFVGQVDHLILGCTHFPLLREEIEALLGDEIIVIDSGEAIAKRVVDLLKGSTQDKACSNQVYCTAEFSAEVALNQYLCNIGLTQPKPVYIKSLDV